MSRREGNSLEVTGNSLGRRIPAARKWVRSFSLLDQSWGADSVWTRTQQDGYCMEVGYWIKTNEEFKLDMRRGVRLPTARTAFSDVFRVLMCEDEFRRLLGVVGRLAREGRCCTSTPSPLHETQEEARRWLMEGPYDSVVRSRC